MRLTEDQARTKWCPAVRGWGNQDGSYCNRPVVGEDGGHMSSAKTLCIASDCMAWRKLTVWIDRATNEPAIPGVTAIGALEERYSDTGYCGLAGKPD